MTGLLARLAGLLRRLAPVRAAVPAPLPAPVLSWPSEADLVRVLVAMDCAMPVAWAAVLVGPVRERGISTPARLGAFLATLAHESGGFRRMVESLDYTPEALTGQWPQRFTPDLAAALGRVAGRAADERAIANRAYGGRMGNSSADDGWRYRGRGLLQLTGRAGYAAAGAALGLPLVDRPEVAAEPAAAARIAAWYWATRGCNALADRGDTAGWRRAVNGGLIGLSDVEARLAVAEQALS